MKIQWLLTTFLLGLLIGVLLIKFLVIPTGLSEESCKAVALEQAREWQDLGYSQGINRGIEICESSYKPMLEQYEPPEECMILIKDKYVMRFICQDDDYYEELNV